MIICIAEKVQEFDHLVRPPYFLLFFLLCVYLLTCGPLLFELLPDRSLTHPVSAHSDLHSFIHPHIHPTDAYWAATALYQLLFKPLQIQQWTKKDKRLFLLYTSCVLLYMYFLQLKKKSSLMNKIGKNVLYPAVSHLSCVLRKRPPPLIYFIGRVADCPSGCRSRTLAQVSLYPHCHGSLSFSLVYNTVSLLKGRGVMWNLTFAESLPHAKPHVFVTTSILFPFRSRGNWGLERSNDLSKFSELGDADHWFCYSPLCLHCHLWEDWFWVSHLSN